MSYVSSDPRRRGLHQQFTPLDLSTDWSIPQVIRVKSMRTLALSGKCDFSVHGITFRNPMAIIQLVGSRKGACATILLVAFLSDHKEESCGFSSDTGDALGTMVLPIEALSGVLHITSSPNVYFRMGGDGEHNAVANDPTILQG
jgi:hypothetical protein